MKKQFYRVKQFADQTFSRSGKAEALSDELQLADRKVEHLRNALQLVSKRLATGAGSTQGQDPAAREKRLKKLPEYLLGLSMCEASNYDDDESILKYILYECGKTEKSLANEIAEHELEVERLVCAPLATISEQDLPAITKAKKHLSRVISEKESAANKYNHLERQIEQNPTKLSSARDELEEASGKVDSAQDALAAELFALVAKEAQLAHTLLQYVKLQRAHHEAALKALEEAVPELELFINNSAVKPVFGYPLEEHLRVNGRTIALPIELCVCVLHELGLNEEGVFRIAGSASKVRRMKLSLDAGVFRVPLPREYRDLHVVAAVLKSYLRELPDPLLSHHQYQSVVLAAKHPHEIDRLRALWDILHALPKHNHDNLRYLLKFLSTLTKNHARNKMTPANLAIVIAPNLLWARDDVDMHVVAAITSVVELLIKHADWFFKDDIDFFVTFTRDDLFPDDYGFSPNFGIIHENANGEYNSMSRSVCEIDGSGHSRSNSHDTSLILLDNHMKKAQSNSSLSDQSSPPHGSPKPITRRKNKPLAPVPPTPLVLDKNKTVDVQPEAVSRTEGEKPAKPPRPIGPEVGRVISGVQTINRSTYRQNKAEKFGSKENLCERRQSLELEKDNQNNKSDSPPSSLVVKSVTAQSGTVARCRVGEVRPIAAPRSVVPAPAGEEDVLLRTKPAVPERPATLRPHSFRGNDAAPVTLERTHVYSVDKQHPTVIQRTHSSGGDPCEPRALSRQLSQSDGSIPETPASPRARPPQRPQVPAPPPPAHPPAAASESTDL